jgi:hypothetical protein
MRRHASIFRVSWLVGLMILLMAGSATANRWDVQLQADDVDPPGGGPVSFHLDTRTGQFQIRTEVVSSGVFGGELRRRTFVSGGTGTVTPVLPLGGIQFEGVWYDELGTPVELVATINSASSGVVQVKGGGDLLVDTRFGSEIRPPTGAFVLNTVSVTDPTAVAPGLPFGLGPVDVLGNGFLEIPVSSYFENTDDFSLGLFWIDPATLEAWEIPIGGIAAFRLDGIPDGQPGGVFGWIDELDPDFLAQLSLLGSDGHLLDHHTFTLNATTFVLNGDPDDPDKGVVTTQPFPSLDFERRPFELGGDFKINVGDPLPTAEGGPFTNGFFGGTDPSGSGDAFLGQGGGKLRFSRDWQLFAADVWQAHRDADIQEGRFGSSCMESALDQRNKLRVWAIHDIFRQGTTDPPDVQLVQGFFAGEDLDLPLSVDLGERYIGYNGLGCSWDGAGWAFGGYPIDGGIQVFAVNPNDRSATQFFVPGPYFLGYPFSMAVIPGEKPSQGKLATLTKMNFGQGGPAPNSGEGPASSSPRAEEGPALGLALIPLGPPPPPAGDWLSSADLPGYQVKVRITPPGKPSLLGGLEPDCIPETLCVSGALPGRPEVFARVVGPKPNGNLWPNVVKFSTSRIEVWFHQTDTGTVLYYDLAAAPKGQTRLPLAGLADKEGFLPPWTGEPVDEPIVATVSEEGPEPPPPGSPSAALLVSSPVTTTADGDPAPPNGPWLTSPALPGFRAKARINPPGKPALAGGAEPDCIGETLCVSGALAGRSEVFVRVVGPKPNGKLWPTLVKFSTSEIEIWLEQTSTGQVNYYRLEAPEKGTTEIVLDGLADKLGFDP